MDDQLYTEFYDPTTRFLIDPRAFCYDLSSGLISQAKYETPDWYDHPKTIQGILLLLFTWNFAARATKELTHENIGELLKNNKSDLKELEQYSLQNIDNNSWNTVESVFNNFKVLMGQTGASKALSLLNPHLFVMWDTKIRARLKGGLIPGIKNGESAEYYVTFLKGMQRIINENSIAKKLPKGCIIAKKIDEYNYVRIVKGFGPPNRT